jgi:hypothetical protein
MPLPKRLHDGGCWSALSTQLHRWRLTDTDFTLTKRRGQHTREQLHPKRPKVHPLPSTAELGLEDYTETDKLGTGRFLLNKSSTKTYDLAVDRQQPSAFDKRPRYLEHSRARFLLQSTPLRRRRGRNRYVLISSKPGVQVR